MLKPNATKTAAREEAERLMQEYRNKGGETVKLDTAVAQGLRAGRYMKRALRGAVAPLGR